MTTTYIKHDSENLGDVSLIEVNTSPSNIKTTMENVFNDIGQFFNYNEKTNTVDFGHYLGRIPLRINTIIKLESKSIQQIMEDSNYFVTLIFDKNKQEDDMKIARQMYDEISVEDRNLLSFRNIFNINKRYDKYV